MFYLSYYLLYALVRSGQYIIAINSYYRVITRYHRVNTIYNPVCLIDADDSVVFINMAL